MKKQTVFGLALLVIVATIVLISCNAEAPAKEENVIDSLEVIAPEPAIDTISGNDTAVIK